jgi:hypothetical protein
MDEMTNYRTEWTKLTEQAEADMFGPVWANLTAAEENANEDHTPHTAEWYRIVVLTYGFLSEM